MGHCNATIPTYYLTQQPRLQAADRLDASFRITKTKTRTPHAADVEQPDRPNCNLTLNPEGDPFRPPNCNPHLNLALCTSHSLGGRCAILN